MSLKAPDTIFIIRCLFKHAFSVAYATIYIILVYTHLLPQGEPATMCLSVCVCALTPSGLVSAGVRGAEVTVSLELRRNDLQGLLSLISIQGERDR